MLIIGRLQSFGQTNRTNSICPCVFFLVGYRKFHIVQVGTDSSAGNQPMLASKSVEYDGKEVRVQM